MKGLKQFCVILLFLALGEMAARLIAGFIPGSVLGMFFLFLALKGKVVKADDVKGAAEFLTQTMGLFFIPAGVGLITQKELIFRYWHVILLAMALSTTMVMAVVALWQQRMEMRSEQRKAKKKSAL